MIHFLKESQGARVLELIYCLADDLNLEVHFSSEEVR